MRRLVTRRSVARVHSVICGWQVNSPGRLHSGDDAMGVAADQLDQLIGAALPCASNRSYQRAASSCGALAVTTCSPARCAPRTITSAYRAWVSGSASALASWSRGTAEGGQGC